ncbi:MAG TPA: cyclic pyranopterin monophosphate synthase MoaC, partial [Thermoanaerobaculia bacterium]|nr:cyclic pyranopterin monophosphate synthase MoaC [Thermoanaerobaculia bacterium]
MSELSHLNEDGELSMVDVGGKAVTRREATAEAVVRMRPETLEMVVQERLPKGDVLATAKIAAILAAKRTADLIPLTHPLSLDHVDVVFDPDAASGTLTIRSTVRCEGKT